jgi:gliding motility-associated-like protein
MKSFFLLPLLLAASVSALAQDFSNKGKDFWLGYGYHVRYVTGGFGGTNGQEMVLYFATENIPGRFTDIRIEIPATGYVQNIINVAPGTIVTSNPIPKSGSQDARLTTEGLFQSGIHVTSSRPVVAYTHIYNGNVSGATLLFPTNTLGKEYYAMNYSQLSNEGSSNAFFFVVATDTGTTTVEITPSAQTLTHAAGVPFVVALNQGEIYNVMGVLTGGTQGNFTGTDLTGSKIQSISSGGVGCKRIAVFSGTGKIKIACNSAAASSDNLIAQAFPKTAWGQKFLTVPTANMPFNFFRIGVSDPSTNVRVNGILQTGLEGNFYYDLPLTSNPQLIEADQPIMVAQYITTAGACGNNLIGGDGDPEMIYLSPVEQTIDEVVLNSTPNAAIGEHWVNVVIRTNAIGSFNITGAQGGYIFLPHPQDPSYSYAQINVTSGSHTLSADSGFNAIAYGYGNAESYGYNAGTNLKDLYNFIEPLNPLNISGTNSACACTPFYYTITYPYQPLSLFWDFKGFQPNVSISNPVADSTYQINGKQVWRYKLPTPYTYCPAGNYPLSITAGIAGADGCGNTQVKDDTLFVRNTPLPDFNWVHNGCVTDSVRFSDGSVYDEGVYSYQWAWDFGDGTTSTAPNPVHKYASPGTYTVSFSLITNIGCISETRAKQVTVTDVPVAKFGVSDLSCVNGPVMFTDSSAVPPPGIIGAWYWDFGDGILDTTFTSNNLVHLYNTAGPKTATLFIETPSGCRSNLFDKTFTIHPKPVVDFNLPAKVCLPYDLANFTDASTIADGTEAGFSWKWKFGEPSSGVRDSSVLKNPAHLYSGVGPFTISLQVTSAAGCADSSSKVLSNVFAKASAGFTVNPENCFNTVTNFSSTSNGQGNTITNWLWDYGDLSAVADGQNVSHTYATPNTFQVKHWILTDKSCFSDTITVPVTVNPLPVANFNFGVPACEKNNVSITDISTAGAGNIITWTWNFGIGSADSIVNNNLPFTYRYDTTGTYTVSLRLLTDKGCSTATALSKTIVINPLPKPGFISPEVCLTDASAQFLDTSSIAAGSITGWAWNFGDPGSGANNTSAVRNALHSYNAIGLYTAMLTVTSNAGCVDSLFQSFTVNGDIPNADFTPLLTVPFCANDTVTITDNSSVNFGAVTKVEIYWDVVNEPAVKETDDLPASGKVYTHRYPDFQSPLAKDFFVRYKSYSGTTCVDSVTKRITVNASPKVQFVTVPPVCLDAGNYQLTEASETGGVPGIGVFAGAGISSTGLFTPSVTGVGTFPVLYTYTSSFGCVDTISNTITVLAPATANFGVSQPRCEKNSISFTDSSLIPAASGSIVNRSWNFGDGTPVVNSASAAPVLHTFTAPGNYPVTLTITSSNGCIVNKQLPVSASPLPVPNFSFPASACLPNASITFTDGSAIADGTENTFTYSWRFGDPSSGNNNVSVSKNPTHVFSTTGPYSITLITQSGAGCRDSVTRLLNTIHPQPIARLTSDSVSICEIQAVRFSDNSDGADGTVNNWSWDFGNGGSSLLQFPPSQTYSNAGIYNIILQIENTFGCKDTAVVPFTVYANPVISAGPDRVLLEGGEITIDASASGSGLQYAWSPVLYLNNPRILKPLVKGIPDDILYTLTVVASGGCWRQDEVLVKLLRAPIIPNTFTPNGDGKNDTWIIQHLESYPDAKIRVFSRDGQALYESNGYNISGWDGRYNGKVLPFGTYYYVIEPGSGRKPITGYVTIIY